MTTRYAVQNAVVHFAGDSGDGMQVIGARMTESSAFFGNDIQTFADFPAEIRAPAGTLPGVSGFQVHFAAREISTPGDAYDTLVAMNPAALRQCLPALKPGGIIIVDENKWGAKDLAKAGYETSPLDGDTLSNYRVIQMPMTRLAQEAVAGAGLTHAQARKCKNFLALGVVFWLYERPIETTLEWIATKFKKDAALVEGNTQALKTGYHYAETAELFHEAYCVKPADFAPGQYRQITGNQAVSLACVTVAHQSPRGLYMSGYPITPASDILHQLARHADDGVMTFQAEDEIAAIGAVIGAAYGGTPAVTTTSGPGLDLKSESLGLAVMTELPLVVVDVQRAGPSTGLPTKTEQSDLLMALYGRHGECPVPVLAPATPGDAFDITLEAFRIAMRYMTPVIVLTDGYLANGAEPWRVPQVSDLPQVVRDTAPAISDFQPYARDDKGARPWAVPGTPGLMHRIGGLEKQAVTGHVSYDAQNHETMVKARRDKVAGLAKENRGLDVWGPKSGDTLFISWGSTFGAVRTAVRQLAEQGHAVAHAQVKQLHPLPAALEQLCQSFSRVVVCELNLGQLCHEIRAHYHMNATPLVQVTGKPFRVDDLIARMQALMTEAQHV